MNDRERWNRAESIFHGALERDKANRAEYIWRECAGDDDLRKQIESLLDNDDRTSPVDRPLVAHAERILGHYRLISKLGEGGMGTVYLARDTRLDRDVALKILSAEFRGDAVSQRRFLAEAKAASALNHPNIVAVYDVGADGKLDYLVMEYVPGKPLDQLIPRNGLKLKETLPYATQIADALACAHKSGIVHRDLKPANVLITEAGVAKIVDFGIAKQVRADQDTGMLTQRGLIFGTVPYMSPEQAEGKPVDARSDLFSFGSLLYEMVTGQRAFQRNSAASTLAAVLRDEPEPANARADDVPAKLAELIGRCHRKSPADRYQCMDDVKVALQGLQQESPAGALADAAKPRPARRRFLWAPAAALATAGIAAAVLWYFKISSPETVLTPVPLTTYPGFESSASFSPDGEQVAFSWCKDEATPYWLPEYPNICNIYIKQIGVEPPSPLTSALAKDFSPAWSPDGKWIAFLRLASAKLSLILISQRGGMERVLLQYDLTTGGLPPGPRMAWTPDSRWLVFPTPGRDACFLSLVAVNSAETRILTRPQRTGLKIGFWGDTAPAISPDGRMLAFSRYTDSYGVYTLSLSEQYDPVGDPIKLPSVGQVNLGAAWLQSGNGILFASGWDGRNGLWLTLAPRGARLQRLPFATTLANEPAVSHQGNRLAYTTYRSDSNIWRVELVGPDRQPGRPVPVVSSTKLDEGPACSPDGKRIAFVSDRSGAREVWLCDRDGSNPHQLTPLKGAGVAGPRWSPDGQSIAVFTGDREIGLISANSGALHVLNVPGGGKWPSWSSDGQWLYFASAHGRNSIWKVRPGGGAPVQITHGSDDDNPQASLDGKFVYYNKGWPRPLSIWRIPSEGGGETKIIEGVSTGGHWTVGADGIYFFTTPDVKGRSEIRLYEFATRRTKKILTVERSVGIKIAVCPDGRTIFYPQLDEHGSDLMLVENFH
jgi:eukaryotic-like serine/threonine-protein kinase